MAASEAKPSQSWVDGISKIIDSVTNLYLAVADKSPRVADTVVILAVIFPFYLAYALTSGQRRREKKADQKVKNGRAAAKKGAKGSSGGKKP